MAKANKSGVLLEGMIYNILKSYTGINITKQYPLNDIFGMSKVDFRIEYKGNIFFIEAKNQMVAGSVDQKLPFYLENIRENRYNGHFSFILNGSGIRNGALSYLKRKQSELNFSIIDFDTVETQLNNMLEHNKMQTINIRISPIIKWAGGKRMIMNDIKKFFPERITEDYHEPFCGGFSVACELYNTGRFGENTKIYLNDNIPQLIILYEVIKENPNLLVDELKKEQYIISNENFDINKKRYNSIELKNKEEVAALFLFLNKTGFNGLYRENKEGKYNVPFSKRTNVKLYEYNNLMAIHHFLQQCHLSCGDYQLAISKVKQNDVVYCDPPYYNTFNSYSKNRFDKEEHQTLACSLSSIKSNEGTRVYISNSDEQLVRELYIGWTIHKIPVKRVVNSKSEDRSNIIYELFIF